MYNGNQYIHQHEQKNQKISPAKMYYKRKICIPIQVTNPNSTFFVNVVGIYIYYKNEMYEKIKRFRF